MLQLWQLFNLTVESIILDVGGNEFNWMLFKSSSNVILLNLEVQERRNKCNFNWIIADGRNLPFKDDAFELVYSNSVIEHLGSIDSQHLFAAECRRVGKGYYVQTPNRRFPVEPHLITPFIHFLPKSLQRRLLKNFTLWGLITRPSEEQCDAFMREVRLLDRQELNRLFPDSKIYNEYILGFVKSIIAVRKPSQ